MKNTNNCSNQFGHRDIEICQTHSEITGTLVSYRGVIEFHRCLECGRKWKVRKPNY